MKITAATSPNLWKAFQFIAYDNGAGTLPESVDLPVSALDLEITEAALGELSEEEAEDFANGDEVAQERIATSTPSFRVANRVLAAYFDSL